MRYADFAPRTELRPYVKTFWTLMGSGVGAPLQRILPDGCFEVVFHFDDPFVHDQQTQPRAIMIGEIRRAVIVQPSAAIDVLGVRFRVGGVAAFLRRPAAELRDLIVPLDDVWRGVGDQLLNTMAADRIPVLEQWLIQRVQPVERITFAALSEIRRSGGVTTIHEVSRTIGATERTLERKFQHAVGMSPKTFARLIRFRTWLGGGDDHYYDDPHRCHEFRAFAGITPRQFFRESNTLHDAFASGQM